MSVTVKAGYNVSYLRNKDIRVYQVKPDAADLGVTEVETGFDNKVCVYDTLMDEALLLLLEKKDFDRITVKELCQKAGLNRTTFYLHYENMNDLLEETPDMINDRFMEALSAISPGDPSTVSISKDL